MSKILLIVFILTYLITIITPAVYDYDCYRQGCSNIEGRCLKNEDCCEGYLCHPKDASWQIVQENGCFPKNPIPCHQLKQNHK